VDVLAEPRGLTRDDYPALYRAADARSLEGQTQYLCAIRLRLALVVFAAIVAAIATAVDGWRAVAWLGAAAFVGAAFVEMYLRTTRPDRLWYDGRAAAESAKSLAWRYAVCGDPFPGDAGPAADRALLDQLHAVMDVVPGSHLLPQEASGEQVTAVMRSLRDDDLDSRRAAYCEFRLRDQQAWYGDGARRNERSLQRWTKVLLGIEFLGAMGCLLQATDQVDFNVAGIAGTLVAAGVAWAEARQHGTVASAYAVAHHELGLVLARSAQVDTEEEWAEFVGEGEEAISREHMLWRASRRA
jgi:hypothetical protein